jgi:DNA mismatch endonuclease, patch repair protein
MTDVLTPEQRRLNMSRIRGRDTKPELLLRRGLHARGFRFRLNRKDLPGCPDLVFPRFRAVMFVHGCFWHWHDCPMFKWPATRTDSWRKKIEGNTKRDQGVLKALASLPAG